MPATGDRGAGPSRCTLSVLAGGEDDMAGFILPDRSLLVRPVIAEDVTAPEIFADGAVVRHHRECALVVFWRGRAEDRRHVLTVPMPRSGFDLSFLTEAAYWQPGPGWPGYLAMQ